jgi:hypothetical protein
MVLLPSCVSGRGLVAPVSPGAVHEVQQVHHAQGRQQPEEIVQMPLVQVVGDPTGRPAPCRGPRDAAQHGRVQVAPGRDREVRQGGAHALHATGRLVVEELEHAGGGEHLRGADQGEGWRLPHDTHTRRRRARGRQTPRLDQRRVCHGRHGQREADAEAAQLRQATVVAGDAPGQRDQHGVVDGDADDDADGVEYREGSRRHGERADAVVHGHALLDERRRRLRGDREEEHHRCPHGEQPEQHLQLLHLGHRAQPPRANRRRCAFLVG